MVHIGLKGSPTCAGVLYVAPTCCFFYRLKVSDCAKTQTGVCSGNYRPAETENASAVTCAGYGGSPPSSLCSSGV